MVRASLATPWHSRILRSFYNFEEVLTLPVDAFLTNSRGLIPFLETVRPTFYFPVAVTPGECLEVAPSPSLTFNVTFLGQYSHRRGLQVVDMVLEEAALHGLALFGASWNKSMRWKPFWHGILPFEQENTLYRSAKVILNLTKQSQRAAGMINNRVFDSLACGACLVSDYFPELESEFSNAIRYIRTNGDVTKHLQELLSGEPSLRQCRKQAYEAIQARHTWTQRVQDLFAILGSVRPL